MCSARRCGYPVSFGVGLRAQSLERRDVLGGYCRRVGREMRGMCNGEEGWMVERDTGDCVEGVWRKRRWQRSARRDAVPGTLLRGSALTRGTGWSGWSAAPPPAA